jgi:hypothetical protein
MPTKIVLVVYLVAAFVLPWAPSPRASPVNFRKLEEYESNESLVKTRDELIFDLVKRRYDGEITRWDGLDSKDTMLGTENKESHL